LERDVEVPVERLLVRDLDVELLSPNWRADEK
jgi:hypothetical protein